MTKLTSTESVQILGTKRSEFFSMETSPLPGNVKFNFRFTMSDAPFLGGIAGQAFEQQFTVSLVDLDKYKIPKAPSVVIPVSISHIVRQKDGVIRAVFTSDGNVNLQHLFLLADDEAFSELHFGLFFATGKKYAFVVSEPEVGTLPES